MENAGDTDKLSRAMQQQAIRIASERLGKPLRKELAEKICQNKWSYMGLEMIIDTVSTIDIKEVENYLSKLD